MARPRIVLRLAQMEGLTEEEFLTRELSKPGPLWAHAERIGVDPKSLRNSRKHVILERYTKNKCN